MHMVLMAANASGIMQETKVGKEMILIVIKGWDTKPQRCIYQIQSCFAMSEFHISHIPECDGSEGSITETIVAVIISICSAHRV